MDVFILARFTKTKEDVSHHYLGYDENELSHNE